MADTLELRIAKLFRLAETVRCPQCGADEEARCQTTSGYFTDPHSLRVKAYDKAQEGLKKGKPKRFEAEQFDLPLSENTGDAKWAVTKRADVPPHPMTVGFVKDYFKIKA